MGSTAPVRNPFRDEGESEPEENPFRKAQRRDAPALQSFGKQFLQGIRNVAGGLAAPLEAVAPLGGVRVSKEGVSRLSPEELAARRPEDFEEPESFAGAAGRFAGVTAAITPLLGTAALAVPRAAGMAVTRAGKLKEGIQNILAETGKVFAKHPLTTTAAQTGLGATAGAGGEFASRIFPESSAAVFVGEILGGVAPTVLPNSILIRNASTIRNFVTRPFTAAGGRNRAIQRFQRAAPGEAGPAAARELEAPSTLEFGAPVLMPAQRAGEPGLLSLEKSVMQSSSELERGAEQQIAHANQVIQESLRAVVPGDVTVTAATLEQGQQHLDSLLRARLGIAAQRADERIEKLKPGSTQEQANRVAKEEVDKALDAATAQEKQLFDAVDQEALAPTATAKQVYQAWVDELGQAQRSDIPGIASRFLSEKSKGAWDAETTIREMRSLQVKLRETARKGRAGGDYTKAKVADEIADALTEDIAQSAAGPEVQAAVEFSRSVKQTFRRGSVGRLLGVDKQGAPRIADALSLEQTIAGSGPKSAQAFDEIVAALDNPALAGIVDSAGFRAAAEDYLKNRFLRTSIEGGVLNVRKARSFVAANETLLNRTPAVRKLIDEALESGDTLALRQHQAERVTLGEPKVSKAALFIQRGPVEAFSEISKLKPQEAAKQAQMLLNRAARDETGEAAAGLKSGFIDFIMNRSQQTQRDIHGQRFLSGFALRELFQDKSVNAVARRLFSEEELERASIIVNDLIKVERARSAKVASEGIIADRPGKLMDRLFGFVGAAVARHGGRSVGAGGTVQIPGFGADAARDLAAAGVRDPATRLIKDAIFDERLFKELLTAEVTPEGKLPQAAQRSLDAWIAAVLLERGGAFNRKEEQQPSVNVGGLLFR